jgi:hypothetical protein
LNTKSVFYGAFVWARRALNRHTRWFLARAVLIFYPLAIAGTLSRGDTVILTENDINDSKIRT